MNKYEFYKYALGVSLLSIIMIAIFSPEYVWPWAITIFAFQVIAIIIANWFIKILRTKYVKSRYLAPGFILYRKYFAFTLTVYLIMGIFGVVEDLIARVYFSLFVIGIIGVSISMLLRILVAGKLLDRFNKKDD